MFLNTYLLDINAKNGWFKVNFANFLKKMIIFQAIIFKVYEYMM